MKKVLFSPIGSTDPIRKGHDGPCLHIIRHYRPEEVVLFLTEEMGNREKATRLYTRAISHVAPNCKIHYEYSGIKNAHVWDEFITKLPEAIRKWQGEDVELLLNLTSGTPQIQTVMAIVTVYDGLKGIQVTNPDSGANKTPPINIDIDDIQLIIDTNLDDLPEAKNRCLEPPLQIIKRYMEKID